jgi:hypothetical protein
LSVCFFIIGSRELNLCTNNTTEFLLERGYKLWPLIRDNRLRNVPKLVDLLDKQLCKTLGVYSLVARDSNYGFAKAVNDYKNTIKPMLVFWEFFKIYTQVLYRRIGYR